jgi:flavodoxin
MKALVAYMSQTGNTRKVAEAIFDEIPGEKEMKKIEEVESIEGYDIAFLGFPVHGEGPDKKAREALQRHCTAGRRVALFITHASPEGDSPELQKWLAGFRQAASGAEVVGTFDCQGQLAGMIKLFMSVYPNQTYRKWAKMDNSKGQPDQTRLERARSFARTVVGKVQKIERSNRTGNGEMASAAA